MKQGIEWKMLLRFICDVLTSFCDANVGCFLQDVSIKNEKSATMSTKGKILVMNDAEYFREFLSECLPDLGYEAEFAKDGAEAIELYVGARASGRPFDVVILDLEVPGGMGGEETIKKLLEIAPDIKAVVSSGSHTHPAMTDFGSYGFSDVLAKPYGIEELEEKLNELMKE